MGSNPSFCVGYLLKYAVIYCLRHRPVSRFDSALITQARARSSSNLPCKALVERLSTGEARRLPPSPIRRQPQPPADRRRAQHEPRARRHPGRERAGSPSWQSRRPSCGRSRKWGCGGSEGDTYRRLTNRQIGSWFSPPTVLAGANPLHPRPSPRKSPKLVRAQRHVRVAEEEFRVPGVYVVASKHLKHEFTIEDVNGFLRLGDHYIITLLDLHDQVRQIWPIIKEHRNIERRARQFFVLRKSGQA